MRAGLKPPLLQQAAFDDLIYKMDVMRNVGSRHPQPEEENNAPPHKWNSLPALTLGEFVANKNCDEEGNGDEGLQEVC